MSIALPHLFLTPILQQPLNLGRCPFQSALSEVVPGMALSSWVSLEE